MSNCIVGQFKEQKFQEGILEPNMFDYAKLNPVKDTDGNEIYFDGGAAILRMAKMTTNREWRNFLWNHVQSAIIVPRVRLDWPIYDEFDGFQEIQNCIIRFAPPDTPRDPVNNSGYQNIWR